MNRFFKTFLLWLLLAVLPLHAVATAMSTSCGPIHRTAMEVALQVDGHHHDGSATAHHHHDSTDATSATPDSLVADDASSGTSHDHHSVCSACAATCIGACGPPSALSSPSVFDGSETVVVSPEPLLAGYIPAGLDRPPRHIFA